MAPSAQVSAAAKPAEAHSLVGLPISVVGPIEVGRLIRELEAIDTQLLQTKLRKDGKEPAVPKTTHLMEQTLELNKLNILEAADRKQLQELLITVRESAPVLHISFSAEPATAFIDKLMTWLRREIHPVVLLTIGMQPNIGAGCIVRSTNKHFDFSLRQDFMKKKDILMTMLASGEKPA